MGNPEDKVILTVATTGAWPTKKIHHMYRYNLKK